MKSLIASIDGKFEWQVATSSGSDDATPGDLQQQLVTCSHLQ